MGQSSKYRLLYSLVILLITGNAVGQLTNSSYVRNLAKDKAVIVFVHGVLGDSVGSWSNGSHYWPAMLRDDPAFDGQNIYVYDYPSPKLGKSFSVDELADNMWLVLSSDGVLKHDSITFVSHSMGGVLTRAFILKYRQVVPKIRLLYFLRLPRPALRMRCWLH
jgi:pimeloyl-ACP methyl ester carboxylesterase